jgi:lysophospholipase L1-like esterase
MIEAALWGASVFAPGVLSRVTAAAGHGDALRVLCVGDSHTYGVLVEPEETYPERLRHHLEATGVPAQVWNLGVPGQNSRQVRNRLPGYLASHAPHVVVVFAGINNAWNVAERDDDVSWTRWLAYRFRLVRFAQLLWGSEREPDGPDVRAQKVTQGGRAWRLGGDVVSNQQSPPADERDFAKVRQRTTDDLIAIVDLVRSLGATPMLVTYPPTMGRLRGIVNDAVRAAADETGAPLIDSAAITKRLVGDDTAALLFEDPGLHPRPALYDEIAREAAHRIAGMPAVSPDAWSKTPWVEVDR